MKPVFKPILLTAIAMTAGCGAQDQGNPDRQTEPETAASKTASNGKLDPRWTRSKHEVVSSADSDSAADGTAASSSQRRVSRMETRGGKVILHKKGAHFYADADVDGSKVHFLVDTGASGIALTGDDARKLGLRWTADELRTVGRGASGAVIGKPVRLGSVKVGGFTVRDVDAVILPNGLDVSLLGQSFLSKIPSVNIRGGQMILS